MTASSTILNTKQQIATETTEGRVKVVAGAGSGKTLVLVHRYAFLVNELGIDPNNILCMTFTNKAASEMKTRIGRLTDSANVNDFVCTIHGFCVKFLRSEIFRIGFPKGFSVIDEADATVIAKQVMEEYGLDRTKMTAKQFLANVASVKEQKEYVGELMVPQLLGGEKNMQQLASGEMMATGYEQPFLAFIHRQLKSFALDFSDLINFTIYILKNYEEARSLWQDRLNYIMVDEAQDCNDRDWTIVEILSRKYNNLFIVGDPDQCIYEWRGARPKAFVDFYADSEIILNENYRSTPNILDVANSIISHNRVRIAKDLFTQHDSGRIVMHYHGKSDEDEAEWTARQIGKMLKEGANPDDFAILYRAAYLSRPIEQALMREKIKYTMWGGTRFFERKEIKDAIAYLKLLVTGDDLSFMRIINYPSRKFGKFSLQKLQTIADEHNQPLLTALRMNISTKDFNKAPLRNFLSLLDDADLFRLTHSISDLFDYMLNNSGLIDELRADEDEERLENVMELASAIEFYETEHKDDEDLSLEKYLQDIALYTNADYRKDGAAVKLMTVHQSKGLEFPYVFVGGLTEGIFPNHRAIRERRKTAEEEERRLMYVAVTRAERALFLTESEGFCNAIKGAKFPSRFLTEIGDGLVEVEGDMDPMLLELTKEMVRRISDETEPKQTAGFKVGDRVMHRVFGVGTIVEASPERDAYKVEFEKGERNLLGRVLTLC